MVLSTNESSSYHADWSNQPTNVSTTLRDIVFVDSNYGWAVGDSGTILTTTDGGMNWSLLSEQIDSLEFMAVEFFDRNIGYVAGNIVRDEGTYFSHNVIIHRTEDGGKNWTRLNLPGDSVLSFSTMDFQNGDTGWIGVNNLGQSSWSERKGVLYKTTDAGTSWTLQTEQSGTLIGAIAFSSESTGFSFWSYFFDNFSNSDVYSTVDGGTEWRYVGGITDDPIINAVCVTPASIWAIGWKASRSTDSGKTWSTWDWSSHLDSSGKRFIPRDLVARNPDTLWLVGGAFSSPSDIEGRVRSTKTSGFDGVDELTVQNTSFTGLFVTSANEGWVVGTKGNIWHSNDVLTALEDQPYLDSGSAVVSCYPNPISTKNNFQSTILFSIKYGDDASIQIYNTAGQAIMKTTLNHLSPGEHAFQWDGTGNNNERVPSGLYIVRISTSYQSMGQKVLIIH